MRNGLIIGSVGTKCWYKDDKLHRDDGPALKYTSGLEYWYQNGNLHRDNGPAIYYPNGNVAWMQNNILHRLDGPAVEHANGIKVWWINYKKVKCSTQKEFENSREYKEWKLKAFL